MEPLERVHLTRDCVAMMVPSGQKVLASKDTPVEIMQALGGSFTIKARGHLLRVEGKDADALGKEPPPKPELPADASDADVEKMVWEQLRGVFDPEIPINIVELGLVYDVKVEHLPVAGRRVTVNMTLTAPGCGMGGVIASDAHLQIMQIPTVEEAAVELVFDPPWHREMMSDEAKLATGMF
ncbi:MAG TPA: putative Fe-S cluster assembly protein SufT [Halothiobacillus sp.]|nr:putative Fe-S cluster assembly protein SufT [Halothiobacillus sp.]